MSIRFELFEIFPYKTLNLLLTVKVKSKFLEAIVIRVVSANSFAMNEIGENNDSRESDQFPKWTNLLCPSCAAYYGVRSLIGRIKKRRRTTIIQNK